MIEKILTITDIQFYNYPLIGVVLLKIKLMKIEQKKELAKLLFVRENLSQKELAVKVGVAEKTISKWVNANEEEWKRMRQSLVVTKEEQLRHFYDQVDELNQAIRSREPGKRYATNKDADTLSKLTSSIKNLETETSISEIIEVSRGYLNWLRPIDIEKAKETANLMDAYIKEKLRR
jgi:transcriptional regulator with XRE-family HTH domain